MSKTKVRELKSLLKTSVEQDFDIIEKKSSNLTLPGEHYGSVMLALDVKIRKKDNQSEEVLNLAAKLIPANEMLKSTFDVQVTFRKEIFAYTKALPTLIKFQEEHNISKEKLLTNFFLKCYGARANLDCKEEVSDDGALLFENLKLQGYDTEDRLKGFDFDGTKVIIQTLARFHAVPIALRQLQPKLFKENILPCLGPSKGFDEWPEKPRIAFEKPIENVISTSEPLKPYLDKINLAVADSKTRPWARRPPPMEPWGTMCHADFWTSNTMVLRDDNGKIIKNKIVDLQMVKYWSCCADLTFFLFTSVINSVLDENFKEFVDLYYKTFIDTIKDYKNVDLNQFSFENFLIELKRAGKDELYHILFLLKPVCIERGKVTNTSEHFQDSDWTGEGLLGEVHRKKVEDTFLSFMKLGWI